MSIFPSLPLLAVVLPPRRRSHPEYIPIRSERTDCQSVDNLACTCDGWTDRPCNVGGRCAAATCAGRTERSRAEIGPAWWWWMGAGLCTTLCNVIGHGRLMSFCIWIVSSGTGNFDRNWTKMSIEICNICMDYRIDGTVFVSTEKPTLFNKLQSLLEKISYSHWRWNSTDVMKEANIKSWWMIDIHTIEISIRSVFSLFPQIVLSSFDCDLRHASGISSNRTVNRWSSFRSCIPYASHIPLQHMWPHAVMRLCWTHSSIVHHSKKIQIRIISQTSTTLYVLRIRWQ